MRSDREDFLFCKHDLRLVIQHQGEELANEIDGYDRNYILNVNVEDLCDHLENKYHINPIILHKSKKYIESHGETDVDVRYAVNRYIPDKSRPFYVKGTSIIFAIPYEGDSALFQCRASTFTTSPPRAEITKDEVLITYSEIDPDSAQIKSDFERRVAEIEKYIGFIANDITPFNNSLRAQAKQKIEARRARIMKEQGFVASFGYPIKQASGMPTTYAVPEVKRKVVIQRPLATTAPFAPEPALDLANYEAILKIISDMVSVMERSPHAFENMKEEDLRQHFLVQLNGHFEGEATGETFNYEGKTDILIRSGGKNIFIAECMFWKGEKSLLEKIDQLLSYTSWRDTKVAVLVFNRGTDFTTVVSQIPDVVKKHQNFKRQLEYKSETGYRCILHHKDDRNRELTLTVLAFNIPKKNP